MTTKGGATRALGKLKTLKLLFFLTNNDSQQLIIVDMIYPSVQQRRFWPCNETHMKLTSADVPQQALNSLCQFCKSVFFVVSLLEASPVHETLWDTKRGSPKVWKSDISCLWLSYKWQENISFSMLGKWQLSLSSFSSRTFLDWKYDILKEAQKSSKKCYFTT